MKRIGILLCSSILMSSCATIFCGSKAKVTFDSDIAEKATLTIDGRKHTNVTFPYTTKIRRGFDETVVKAESPAYTTETVIINKSFNAVSVINLHRYTRLGHRRCDRSHHQSRNSNSIRSTFSRKKKNQ
ncbi:MAG: hypothetical protein ACLUYV_02580 [Alistipes shahii]